jgi:hypothetical protein
MQPAKNRFSFLFVSVLLISILSACSTGTLNVKDDLSKGAEKLLPPSPPVQEVAAQYKYRYYPSTQVYFNINWGKYYYLSDGLWKESYELPSTIKLNKDSYVTLSMDADNPYKFHKDVIKKYPSGWIKKYNTQTSKINPIATN